MIERMLLVLLMMMLSTVFSSINHHCFLQGVSAFRFRLSGLLGSSCWRIPLSFFNATKRLGVQSTVAVTVLFLFMFQASGLWSIRLRDREVIGNREIKYSAIGRA